MKKETKELIKWIKDVLKTFRSYAEQSKAPNVNETSMNVAKAFDFLNSFPEIESHLCRGGFVQDKNGTPCCHGDKIRFEFKDKDYNENFSNRFERITEGELIFCEETKSFQILFGAGDWTDWTTEDYGCKWFEKVK